MSIHNQASPLESDRTARTAHYAAPVAAAEQMVIDHMPELVGNLIKLANGIQVERHRHDGAMFKITLPPDRKAIVYLLDRVLGRPARQWAPPTAPEKPLAPVIMNGQTTRDPVIVYPRVIKDGEFGIPGVGRSFAAGDKVFGFRDAPSASSSPTANNTPESAAAEFAEQLYNGDNAGQLDLQRLEALLAKRLSQKKP